MNKIDQTRFGGKDAPVEEQGNCFQACVATVLQIPLEEAYDCIGVQDDDEWFDDFNKWLVQYGLGCIFFEHSEKAPVKATSFRGIYMVECMSKALYHGERHCVVVRDEKLLHDPNPHAKEQGDCQGIYIFVPLRPYELVRR